MALLIHLALQAMRKRARERDHPHEPIDFEAGTNPEKLDCTHLGQTVIALNTLFPSTTKQALAIAHPHAVTIAPVISSQLFDVWKTQVPPSADLLSRFDSEEHVF